MKKILSWLIVVAMIVAMMPAVFATEGSEATYTKISGMEELTSGEYVLICSNNVAMGQLDNGWVTTAAPVVDGDVVTDAAGAVWTLTVDGTNVKLADANGAYIAPKGGNNNGIKEGEYNWTVSCTDGVFAFQGQGSDTVTLAGNTDYENKFRGYKNTTVTGSYADKYPAEFTLYKLTEAEEEIVVENPIYVGDTEMELPRGTTETITKNFVATETGTLYVAITDFMYEGQYTEGYVDNSEYMGEFAEYTTLTINGESLSDGFYGTMEVTKGQVYTFVWTLSEEAYYGYKVTMNLSYTDENMPKPGQGVDLLPSHLPMNTVEIPAGGKQLYQLSFEFSGYLLQIHDENAYISYEMYDWWTGEPQTVIIEAEDGVVSYDIAEHASREIYIHNAGTEAAVFEMTCFAPLGGEKNPIIVENLEEINIESVTGEYTTTYFQWTATEVGEISVLSDGTVDLYFTNVTKDEGGYYDSTWEYYNVYVEEGDVLLIMVGGGLTTGDYWFEYTFNAGYRSGSMQNPMEVDLMLGLDVDVSDETVYFSWTPDFTGTVALNFTYKYSWSSNLATMMIGEEEFTYGVIANDGETVISESAELAVVAGEPIVFSLSAPNSVYGTMIATVLSNEEEPSDEEVLYNDTVTTTDETAYMGEVINLVAPGDGTITVTFVYTDIYPEYQVIVFDTPDAWGEWQNVLSGSPDTMTCEVREGNEIQISVATQNASGDYVGGSVEMLVTFTPGEVGGDEVVDTELELGENNIAISGGATMSPQYTFIPEQDGLLNLELLFLQYTYQDLVQDVTAEIADYLGSMNIGLQVDGYDYTEPVAVTAGTPVIITMTQSRMYSMYGYSWDAILNLTITEDQGGDDPVEPGDTNALVLGDNEINQDVTYTFTAEQEGTLIINFISIIWDNSGTTPAYGLGNWVDVQINGQSITQFYNTVDVAAGDVVTIYMINIDSSVYTATVNLSYAEPARPLQLGFNDLETFQNYFYTAEQTGTLYLTVTDVFNVSWGEAMDDLDYYIGYGYIMVTLNGEAMTAATAQLEVNAGDEITLSVNTSQYTIETEIFLSYEGFYEHPLGSERNPVVLAYTDCPTTTVEIPAGESVWYSLDNDFGEAVISVYGENAYILVRNYDGTEIRYDAVDGVVTYVPGDLYIFDIRIGNDGAEAATFAIEAYIPEGSYSNPAALLDGDNSCDVLANQTFYWTWTAAESGTLTLTFGGEDWVYYIYHNNSYHSYGNQSQGDPNPVVIEVEAGDVVNVQVRIQTADYSSHDGTISINVAFETSGAEVLAGDANGDGEVNYMDAIMVLQYYTEEEAEGIDLVAADFNNDGEVNYLDAIAILQFYVENEE